MFFKIAVHDIVKNKGILIILFIFMLLSAILISSAVSIFTSLSGSIDTLFEKADTPHYLQMQSGPFSQKKIDEFTARHKNIISSQQSLEMLDIDGSNIYLGNTNTSESGTAMDISFTVQSPKFDYLLNLNNELLNVKDGYIAVPIYYMEKNGLSIGDPVTVKSGNYSAVFKISDFVRDSTMNSSVCSSKRFVVSENDYNKLKSNLGECEYLIEFKTNSQNDIDELARAYQNEGMPHNGPALTYSMFRMLSAISDGILIAVLLLIAVMLIIISVLCIRFTFLSTIEEDISEIGVLKAIGIRQSAIKRAYLVKYSLLTGISCVIGYFISRLIIHSFTKNITLYMGAGRTDVIAAVAPVIALCGLLLLFVLFCLIIMRRLGRISAIEVLRGNQAEHKRRRSGHLKLSRTFFSANFFLGVKDVLVQVKKYLLIFIIFIFSMFIVLLPLNLKNTFNSPDFVHYLGVGKCDIRMDLQNTGIHELNSEITSSLKNDERVKLYSSFATCKYKIQDKSGTWNNVNIELGDFSRFPVEYLKGSAPKTNNQISLSYLEASDLDVDVGDKVNVLIDGKTTSIEVCGIYQDITNGGNTAKARFNIDESTLQWYVIDVSLKDTADLNTVLADYQKAYPNAKILGMNDYVSQTMGNVTSRINLIAWLCIILVAAVTIIITAIFIKLLILKDRSDIALLQCLGFFRSNITVQYAVRALTVLIPGIIVGTFLANILGEKILGLIGSMFGAPSITFIVNGLEIYCLLPLAMILLVTVTTMLSTWSIREKMDLRSSLQ